MVQTMKKGSSNVLLNVCILFLIYVVMHRLTISPRSKDERYKGSVSSKFTVERSKIVNCDRTDKFYDLCLVDAPSVIDPSTSTLYLKEQTEPPYVVEKIKPYPRKWQAITMRKIREFTLTSNSSGPPCHVQHQFPALVFSVSKHAGKVFVDFNEGFVPLFITVNYVYRESQEFIIVLSEAHDWWIERYKDLLQGFSKQPIIKLENEKSTHCFPSASVGLVSHGFMSIDPTLLPKPKTFLDFHNMLAKFFNGEPKPSLTNKAPKLLLMSRNGSSDGRVLRNEIEVVKLAEEIGFSVSTFKQDQINQLKEIYTLVSSSHVMIGTHDSELTYSLFLRPGSIFLQVIPLGMEEFAEVYFGNSAKEMGLDYMEYNIEVEESSLIDKYDKNSLMIQDPVAYIAKNWSNTLMSMYKKEQDVTLNLARFKEYLIKIYNKITII